MLLKTDVDFKQIKQIPSERRCYLHIDVFLVGSKREQLKQFVEGLGSWILFQILDQFIKFFFSFVLEVQHQIRANKIRVPM